MVTTQVVQGWGPLVGLRVVDATQEPDALLASTLLADLGADVIMLKPRPLAIGLASWVR